MDAPLKTAINELVLRRENKLIPHRSSAKDSKNKSYKELEENKGNENRQKENHGSNIELAPRSIVS